MAKQEHSARNLVNADLPNLSKGDTTDHDIGEDKVATNAAAALSSDEKFFMLLEALSQQANPNTELMERLANAIERMTDGQMSAAQLVANATKKAQRPSNEAFPGISVFNPRGDKDFPRQALRCPMYIPWPVEYETCDREELELLNLLPDYPGEYVIKRIDKSRIKLTLKVEYGLDSKTPSRLLLNHETAFRNEEKDLLPATADTLRQILYQTPNRSKAKAVVTMDEEMDYIAAGLLNTGEKPEPGGVVVSVGE